MVVQMFVAGGSGGPGRRPVPRRVTGGHRLTAALSVPHAEAKAMYHLEGDTA